jgi:hypothetical protein
MRRGSSLADFAEKINADPAALVSALFHLGEMVTATQSVDADTFEILAPNLDMSSKLFHLRKKIVSSCRDLISISLPK